MNIDEFLEREIVDLGMESGKNVNVEAPIESQVFKEESAASTSFEAIKSSLGSNDLDSVEKSYAQLWQALLDQKLKWNKGLYDQLLLLNRHFNASINYAQNDIRKKADQIYDLISSARIALREGKKEVSFRIYSQITELSNTIPHSFFEEKKVINEQISVFYKELKNAVDNDLIKRVFMLVQEIFHLIDKAGISVNAGDIPSAITCYNKCVELFSQIPEGFLKHKNSAGMRLLEVYRVISIYNEMINLQQLLSNRQPAPRSEMRPRQPSMNAPYKEGQESGHLSRALFLQERNDSARMNIEKGLYGEATRDIEEALRLAPDDIEAKALQAKIKTLR